MKMVFKGKSGMSILYFPSTLTAQHLLDHREELSAAIHHCTDQELPDGFQPIPVKFYLFCPQTLEVLSTSDCQAGEWVAGECTVSVSRFNKVDSQVLIKAQDALNLAWMAATSTRNLNEHLTVPVGLIKHCANAKQSFWTIADAFGGNQQNGLVLFIAVPSQHRGVITNHLAPNNPQLCWTYHPRFVAMHDAYSHQQIH